MGTIQTNIRLDKELRGWYDAKGREEDRDAAYFMRKALVQYRDEATNQASVKEVASVAKNATVKVSAKEARPKTKRFVKPEIGDVSAYFYEKGSQTCQDSAQAFIDFYESKGWLVGKSPMKCWKAAVRNWMKNDKNPKGQYKTAQEKRADRNAEIFDYEKATNF